MCVKPFVTSTTYLTVITGAFLSLCLSNPTVCWASTLLDRTYMKSTNKSLPQSRDKEVIKNGGQLNSCKSPMDEREREQNILLCLSASIGGALITVQVKLNMREISRAAGVCGGEWGGGEAIKRRQGLARAFKS